MIVIVILISNQWKVFHLDQSLQLEDKVSIKLEIKLKHIVHKKDKIQRVRLRS